MTSGGEYPKQPPFLAWPGFAHVAWTSGVATLLTVLFCAVYGGADLLTGLHGFRFRVHTDAELAIPFVPAMTVLYSSIYPLFGLAPFVLRTREEVLAFARTIAIEVLVAGPIFVLLPAEMAYPPADGDLGIWEVPFRLADFVNRNYNLVPSLHVAFAVTSAATFGSRCGTAGRIMLGVWAAGVCASTLLTHQHHVVDVVAGIILWLAVARWTGRRTARRSPHSV